MPSSRAHVFVDVGHRGRVDEMSSFAHLTGKIAHEVAWAFVEDGPEHVDMYVVEEQLSWTMVWPHERERIPIFAFARPMEDALSSFDQETCSVRRARTSGRWFHPRATGLKAGV